MEEVQKKPAELSIASPAGGVNERFRKRASESDLQSVLDFTALMARNQTKGLTKGASTAAGNDYVVRGRASRAARQARRVVTGLEAAGAEVGMVEEVEEVHAELHAEALFEVPVLDHLYVEDPGIGAVANTAGSHLGVCSAKMIADQSERCRIQDLAAAHTGIAIDAGNERAVVVVEPGPDKGVQVKTRRIRDRSRSACEHAERRSGFHGDDAVDFPPADCVLGNCAVIGELGQEVDFIGHEDVRPVDVRIAFVEGAVAQVCCGFLIDAAGRVIQLTLPME